jgi:hypothetical protein
MNAPDVVERLLGHSKIMERDKGKFVRFIDVATCIEAVDLIATLTAERDAAIRDIEIYKRRIERLERLHRDIIEFQTIAAGAHKDQTSA